MEFGICRYLFHQFFHHIDKASGLFSPYNTDTAVELIDTLSANQSATSVVQLTLSPFFTRHYSILTHTINNYYKPRSLTTTKDNSENNGFKKKPMTKSNYTYVIIWRKKLTPPLIFLLLMLHRGNDCILKNLMTKAMYIRTSQSREKNQ